MINGFAGMRIIEDPTWVTRKQARTHRKKRINKKWAKRYGFKIVPKKEIIKIGDMLIMHPVMFEALRKKSSRGI